MSEIKKRATAVKSAAIVADPASFNHVAEIAKLDLIQMNGCTYSVKPRFFTEQKNVKMSFDRRTSSVECVKECTSVFGFFTYSVDGKIGNSKVLSCSSQFMVAYSVNEECQPDALKAFCERTGMLAAYAYFRGLFANLASLSNIELPPLPMVNFQPMRKPAESLDKA